MNITITSPASQPLLSTPVNSGAKGYYSLMQHDYITLPFSLQSPVEFGIGSYADLREAFSDALGGKLAKIYKVCDLQTPTYNTSTGGYDYELRLDAYYWLWKNKIFKYTPEAAGQEASWSLTASLDVHLGVFLRNLNALGETYGGKEYEFSIDSTVENKAVAITYDNTNLIDALSRMAEAWDCEWWVTENVIHFGRLENGDAVELEIGVQAEDMTRNESKGTYATRIYAFGSTRNIPENYRPNDNEDLTVNGVAQKRLMLPDGTPYIDARPGLTGQEVVESVVVFDDIYPRRVGTLSDVKTVDRAIEDEEGNQTGTFKAYQYKDTGLTFSPDYVLEGQELRIVFQSGKMNGLDFGVTFNPDNADPAEQLWEIVANEDYGRRLPDEVIKPENGDTYILYGFDIKLVSDQYIPAAEQELKAKAEEYVAKTQVDDGTYTVPLYSSWVEADEVNRTFDAGQRVKLKNPAFFGTSGRTSRVIGWEMCLDIPYDRPIYTIGESAQYSRLGELEDKVDSLTLNGQAYQGIGGGSGVYLIRTNDSTPASNSNAYSALRARQEFISKTKDDTAKGKITFVKGIDVGTFSQNAGGGTFRVLEDLTTYAEVDRLRVRVKAYFETLEIINTNSVGGKMILTAGGGVYLREVKDRETLEDGTEQVWDFYRCYFLTEQDGREVENRFHVGDLAMSQSFNIKAGTHQGVTNHYYWREVVGIGDDYIDLSKTICDTGSDAPMAEDTVCHLGNRSDKDRQGAIIFSAVDVFSPSITLYYGINDFSLVNKDYVSYGVDKSTGNAFFRVYGEMYAGDREQTSYVKYTPGVGVEMRGKFLNQAGESYDTIIDSIQNAIDGNIETWFGEEEPTLSNEPAVNWTTDEDKNTHLGDLYYSDAGVAYRFQMEGANYVWKMLKDSDITKALADAKAAKDAADAAQEAADAAADRLTAWASDGVISPTEKQGIKDEIARIDADKANITAQYTKYGLGTPTAFNNAYTAYRSVLVSLSASTPENIAIPSDFSSKQTYYYNERTSALGAIADASISSVNDVTEQLEQMQQEFADVKEDVNNVKTSVDGLKNFTDEAFADGIVDRNESAAIASHINSIETFAKDAAESYTKVYENTLLTGTAKTNLVNAYTAFTTAKTELVTTINGAIADGLVDALEKSAVDGKYTAFNTKYGDFVANLNAANRAIQDAINQNALQALQKIGELDYLKAALKEFTTIEGGLIQSSTLALGYTSDSGYQVMAGTNGIYDASKLGGGIASWWGGAMFDRFEYTEETMPESVASALVRMDGTGYFAKGNLWWESDGTLHADPLSFFVGKETVGDVLGLFQFVKSDAGVEYVIPQHPFQKLEIGNYLQIGKAQLYWDEANQAFYVRHQDGVSPVGFYATGFISAKGANPDAGGAVSGSSSLDELSDVALSGLQDGQVLAYDTATQKWVNKSVSAGGMDEEALEAYLTENQYAKKGDISIAGLTDLHSSWDALLKAQKPTTLAGYGIADGVNDVSVTGSGNVVTSASVSGHVLTLTKGVNALTSVSLSTISDLHSSWDAVLKAQKPAWLTTVSLATISDLHASWDALLKSAPTVYVTRWPTAAEVGALTQSTGDARYALTTGTNASGTWPISISGNAATATNATQLGGLTWSNFNIQRIYTISTSGLSTSNFYPIFFNAGAEDLHIDIHSTGGMASAAYNINRLNFIIHSNGWDDSGESLTILTSYTYDANEITIGAIGCGTQEGGIAVWVRGGIGNVYIRSNFAPSLKTSNYTYGNQTYSVGTNLYGGTNKNVAIMWQNNSASRNNNVVAYLNSNVYSATKLQTARKIWGQPFNGEADVSGALSNATTITASGQIQGGSFKLGSGTITWDSTNNCFHFSHGLYSDSFVSAKGANSGSGGTVSGVTKLSDLSDVQLGTLATNQVLSWNGSKWVNKAISTGLDETALAQYLTNNGYATQGWATSQFAYKTGTNASGTWPISITGSAYYLKCHDTRNVNTLPNTFNNGFRIEFKRNSVEGLSDGGDYHGSIYYRQYGSDDDWTGGHAHQLGFTDNGNIWHRNGTASTWNTWKKLLDSSNYASTLDTRYVKKAGDTMTGKLIISTSGRGNQLLINNTAGGEAFFYLQSAGVNKGAFSTMNPDYGTCIFDATSSKFLGIKTNGTPHFQGYTLWHAGNDGSGSGLDADLLDGYHRSNLYNSVDTWLSSVGLSKTITVTGDKNTYYPVEITVSSSKRIPTIISIHKDLNSTTPDISGNHSNGTSSLWLIYEMRKTTWDGNGGFVRTVYKSQPYATLVANAKNNTQGGGNLIVWLRGGTCSYQVTCTNTFTATPYYTTTNVSHVAGFTDNVSPTTSIGNGGIFGGIQWFGNVTGNVTGNAATATQLQTARTIWGQSFNGTANVSGDMTGVGSFTGVGQFKYGASDESNATYGKYHRLNLGYHSIDHTDFYEQVFNFYNNGGGTTWAKIGSTNYFNGNVGIGTTSPSHKLHVAGTGYFSGITTDNYIFTNTGWFQNNKSACGLYNSAVDARWYANSSGWISDKKINANAGLAVTGAATFSSTITASGKIRTSNVFSAGEYQDDAYGYYNCTRPNTSGTFNCYSFVRSGNFAFGLGYNSSNQIVLGGATSSKGINPWIYITSGGVYTNGYLSAKGNNSSSDIRLKNILCPVRPPLEAFAKAPLFRFAWKSDPGMVEIGSSAQYWRNVLPDTVKERDGWLEMGYGNIALAGVITIARDFETLEQRVDRLEKENGKLKKRIKELERRTRE